MLHLIPQRHFATGCAGVIGNGVVIDQVALMEEIRLLEDQGISVDGQLWISQNAHLIMPYQIAGHSAKKTKCGQNRGCETSVRRMWTK